MWDGFLEVSVKFLARKTQLVPCASKELAVLVIAASIPQLFTFLWLCWQDQLYPIKDIWTATGSRTCWISSIWRHIFPLWGETVKWHLAPIVQHLGFLFITSPGKEFRQEPSQQENWLYLRLWRKPWLWTNKKVTSLTGESRVVNNANSCLLLDKAGLVWYCIPNMKLGFACESVLKLYLINIFKDCKKAFFQEQDSC